MPKVLSIIGTRPEAIKMALLIRGLAKRRDVFASRVCVTAQHRQMLDQVLEQFDIVPNYDLDVMENNQSPTQVSAAIMSKLEPVLKKERPDWVLVQGDTSSTAAAALAAFYAGARVAHVEAGLRSGDKWQPFPEEINRRMTTVIADLHFAPTERARKNLLNEGVSGSRIFVTGNPVVDALHWALQREPSTLLSALFQRVGLSKSADELSQRVMVRRSRMVVQEQSPKLILASAHRRENFGQPLENICEALKFIAENFRGQVQIVFLLHPNPNACELAQKMLDNVSGITLLPPLDYLSMVHLLNKSHFVVTDSGGLQEEAASIGKPILVMRNVTDRPESIEAGIARIVGVESETIIKHITNLLEDEAAHSVMAKAGSIYGEGQASEKIIEALLSFQSAG